MSGHDVAGGAGAAKAKGGKNRQALNRGAGYAATMAACESKVRSQHTGSSRNNLWQGKGDNAGNDNLKGYE